MALEINIDGKSVNVELLSKDGTTTRLPSMVKTTKLI